MSEGSITEKLGRAKKIASRASLFALLTCEGFRSRYPELRTTSLDDWNLFVGIAGVAAALQLVERVSNIGTIERWRIRRAVRSGISEKFNQIGHLALNDCENMLSIDKPKHGGSISVDHYRANVIGTWVYTNLFRRMPEANDEISLSFAIGLAIDNISIEFWEK